jgi:NADH:ubiquinone reductase (H+-translocating)
MTDARHVVIVGGGMAGLGCARRLAKRADIRVTLIDKHNYHQFQPLLYQVATCQLAPSDVATSLRKPFRKQGNVAVRMGEVTAVDPVAKQVTLASGQHIQGDFLVLAAGSQPNFFRTPGAEHTFPMYSLDDAQRLRSRILTLFEDADRDPSLLDRGALNFVIVGAGATGTETAGALAEMIRDVMPHEYQDLAVRHARVILVDLVHTVLGPFSDKAHEYAAKVLQRDGVELRLGTSVREVHEDRAVLSDGTTILTHCVVWGGGIMASPLAANTGLAQGRGGRIDVEHDLTVPDRPGVYALGDFANIPAPDGSSFPQLGSVALQSGQWAAKNIEAELAGKPPRPFHYHDKGIMAMIGRNAAIAEMGEHRHELHGPIAFASWLGVHAWLMTGARARVEAFIDWGWDYFSKSRGPQVLDRTDVARIDWGDDDEDDEVKVGDVGSAVPTVEQDAAASVAR